MQKRSHKLLASMLLESEHGFRAKRYELAFLFGSFQPDCNPLTYLKGSRRARKLRGHNFTNSRLYIESHIKLLQARTRWNIWQYYTLGKLIHYTTDAFTYAHNDTFPTALSDHREYEAALQDHFLEYMKQDPKVNPKIAGSVMEAIYSYHREYEAQAANIYTDTRFALNACCCVLAVLLTNPIF